MYLLLKTKNNVDPKIYWYHKARFFMHMVIQTCEILKNSTHFSHFVMHANEASFSNKLCLNVSAGCQCQYTEFVEAID